MNIRNLSDVVRHRMCTGCGACVAACPVGSVHLVDVHGSGIRPCFDLGCGAAEEWLRICPGYEIASGLADNEYPEELTDPFIGTFLDVWEGWAVDPQIRFRSSSGGVLTALALYCLDHEGISGVLQVGPDPSTPWRNKTRLSRTHQQIIECAGSRYSPASPCDGLRILEEQPLPGVFIGKPTDVTAAQLLRRSRPILDRKLSLVMSFFCAGTPSTQGTLDLLRYLGVNPDDVTSLLYRGKGWPGGFEALTEDGGRAFMPYEDAWSKLTHYKALRENLEPDGFGRNADITCGDAWHVSAIKGYPGVSVVVVRSERGRSVLQRAENAGYISLRPTTTEKILSGQMSLVEKQRELYGRLVALRLFGIPTTKFPGFLLRQSFDIEKYYPPTSSLTSMAATICM